MHSTYLFYSVKNNIIFSFVFVCVLGGIRRFQSRCWHGMMVVCESVLLLSWFIGSVQPETAMLHIHKCSPVLGVTKLLLHQFPQSQCSLSTAGFM